MSGNPEEGIVSKALPKGLFEVELDSGRTVLASLSGVAKQVTVKVIPGDRVLVEVSPYDPTRGRITARTS